MCLISLSPSTCSTNHLVRQVEGELGVSKLASCISDLPPTILRAVIVGARSNGGGLDAELGGVLESRLWTDAPDRTIVFVPAATESQEVATFKHEAAVSRCTAVGSN